MVFPCLTRIFFFFTKNQWLPAIVNRIQQLASDEPVFFLVLMHSVCTPLQGFANVVVYSMTEDEMMASIRHPTQLFKLLRARMRGEAPPVSGVQEYAMSSTNREIALDSDDDDNRAHETFDNVEIDSDDD